jgi:hypothetical protein
MNLKDMQGISERYQKIKETQEEIDDMNKIAQYVLDNQNSAWVSVDIELEGEKETKTEWVATLSNFGYTVNEPNTIGFSVEVPDTIVLEAIGILLRNKQQRIKKLLNDNNI